MVVTRSQGKDTPIKILKARLNNTKSKWKAPKSKTVRNIKTYLTVKNKDYIKEGIMPLQTQDISTEQPSGKGNMEQVTSNGIPVNMDLSKYLPERDNKNPTRNKSDNQDNQNRATNAMNSGINPQFALELALKHMQPLNTNQDGLDRGVFTHVIEDTPNTPGRAERLTNTPEGSMAQCLQSYPEPNNLAQPQFNETQTNNNTDVENPETASQATQEDEEYTEYDEDDLVEEMQQEVDWDKFHSWEKKNKEIADEISMVDLAKMICHSERNITKSLLSMQSSLRNWQCKAIQRIKGVEQKQEKYDKTLKQIEDSQNENEAVRNETIRELAEVKQAHNKMLHAMTLMNNEMKKLKIESNQLQRNSREYNIRIYNMAAVITQDSARNTRREDTVSIVVNLFSRNNLYPGKNETELREAIDTAFRVGQPRAGKTRCILVKFNKLNIRNLIMQNGRKMCKDNKTGDVYFQDDYTPSDLAEKERLKPLIKSMSTKERPVYYKRGRVIVAKEGKLDQGVIDQFLDSTKPIQAGHKTLYRPPPPPQRPAQNVQQEKTRYLSAPQGYDDYYNNYGAYGYNNYGGDRMGYASYNSFQPLFTDTKFPFGRGRGDQQNRGYRGWRRPTRRM